MMERKLFKTKLCILYQRGHCNRQSCSFAHGEAELRRFGSSSTGRRDYRGGDLRSRLGKRYSPRRRYSPGRDGRSRDAFHGYSPSRSPEDNSFSDRKRRKRQHMGGQNDVSDNLKMLDATEIHVRGGKLTSSDSRYALQEQLKQVQSDISVLNHHKSQLGIYLEERVQEADTLASKIKELEGQLYKEKKECKRINSRIKKFIKAHHRFSRLQDEVKRSQIQLQNLGEQLGFDAIGVGNKEEDSSINILSDGETPANHVFPRAELQVHDSPNMKVSELDQARPEEPQEKLKFSKWNAPQLSHTKVVDALDGRKNVSRPSGEGGKHKREKDISSINLLGDKLKGSGITAHAVDVYVDIEDENIEVAEAASTVNEEATLHQNKGMTFMVPPLPPISKNIYAQYAGDDEKVDVASLGEKGEMNTISVAE